MRWNAESLNYYAEAKEYVDTALIPLVPFNFQEKTQSAAEQGEYVQLLSEGIEKQFAGRIMLTPPYTYLQTDSLKSQCEALKQWDDHLLEAGFAHRFYITGDPAWRSLSPAEEAEVIWMPPISLSSMEMKQVKSVISQQIDQIVPLITGRW
ncbi:YpiF family protein [Salisediminibacterium halotolerans]|uniref:YpiF family protein n=1 Tax=Salisediminibacterium halotolerans TaxID=517425 RepID=UPI000EAF658F|nr:YpiF family protein [Salisediminibacterium halotolerans]RLJ77928.1 uncharacterized protein DUF2487 [Actinophytocola xinjiangensis]RPE88734.1 uncharacterized protein DUF2487 [Salisediminibacterium halotolerans]TWG36905.1 uncharacterized protein DUF2487 [Salisediminibacterium halotolerans]GEL07409.1 hypothetical protein SHA02_08250 [Salisediminibacterium halotolerans]